MIFSVKRKNLISIFAVVSILLCLFSVQGGAVSQSDIDDVRRQRDEVAAQKAEQQKLVEELSSSMEDVIDAKLALEEKVAITREQITLNEQEIALYDKMIEDKAAEVEQAKAQEALQLEKYRTRVRAMEENGTLNILVLISESRTLSDLLTALDDAGAIMESDKALEDQYIAARQAHEAKQAEYEDYRKDLLSIREVLADECKQLENDISEAESKIDELEQEICENEELLHEMEARWEALNSKVGELQSQYDNEHAPGSMVGSGGFIWPCGAYYITSRQGNRYHPVSGSYSFHSGTDIGCPDGNPIWAAASGSVTLAGWNGNFGNCVIIDHGNGYTSLYAHLSSVCVSSGQGVSSGQTIGNCGSTGLATGPHLHFEIRSGGGCVDPENFFPEGSFSFAPDA